MRKLLLSLMLLYIAKGTLLAQDCSINAGLSTTICLSDTIKLYGTRSGLIPQNVFSKWTQISGPIATILNPDSLITIVEGNTSGTYLFKLSNRCLDGIISEDTISVTKSPLTKANAGRDTVLCPIVSFNLNGNLPSANENGVWTISSNGAGITIASPTSPTSAISLPPNYSGRTTLMWTITNSKGCSSSDEIIITNRGGVAPVNAGPDQTLSNCYSSTTCAKLIVSNGGIGIDNQIGTWTFVSGSSVPELISVNNLVTLACNLSEGVYVFRYTVSGPCVSGVDEVVITVLNPTLDMPIANAGSSFNICGNSSTITLTGVKPSFIGEVSRWSQITGPVNVTIHTPNNPTSIVTGLTLPGVYTFKYEVTNLNTGCSAISKISCTLYGVGTIDAGSDQILPCNITETIITPTISGSGYVTYRIISGPYGAFNYPTPIQSLNKIQNMRHAGTYRVEVSYLFGTDCSSVNDYVDITVSKSPTGSNAGSYQNFTCASTSTQLAGNNPLLTGFGSGRWSQVQGPNTAILVNPNNYICDVTGTIPGSYIFRWTISNGNTCPDNHDDILVITPGSTVSAANSGNDRTVCYNSAFSLFGSSFRADETGVWTVSPSTGVSFFPSNKVATPAVNGLSANTVYQFVYTITNSCGKSSSDSVLITTGEISGPSNANAGTNQCLASGTNTIHLNAIAPVSGVGCWSQIAGAPCTVANPFLCNSLVTNLKDGTYKFAWTVSTNGCSNDLKDTIVITISANTSKANAGLDIKKCGNSITLNANTPEFGTGHWSQITGDGSAVIDNINNPVTNVGSLFTGVYTFRWTISNDVCTSNFDDISVDISTPPSIANAGPDQSLCGSGTSVTLNAVTPTSGSGMWLWLSGSGTAPVITNNTSPKATITKIKNGLHIFTWIVTGGPGCPQSTDNVVVNVSTNADAGLDKNICNATSITLKGNQGSKGIWSQISGPASTILQTPIGNPNANITGLVSGKYIFRYTISAISGCPSTFDDVLVNNGASASVPNAGVDDVYCNVTAFNLNGNIPASGETGFWSVLSSQTDSKFLPDANKSNTILSNVTTGTYLLKWTISNGLCSSSDVKRIENYAIPTIANAGIDDTLCLTNKVSLKANMPVNGIGKWSQISGPNTVIFDAPNNPNSNASELIAGTYRFLWTISNHTCTESSDEVSITVLNSLDPAFAGNDLTICATIATLNGNSPSNNNKGIWTQISGPNTVLPAACTNPVTVLTNLVEGNYKFVWKIFNERCSNSDTISITVNPAVYVKAGADFKVCNKIAAISLSEASVSGYTTIGSWSIVSGEGMLSNTEPTTNPAGILFYPSINYSGPVTLRLTAVDNCQKVTDDITILVIASVVSVDAINDTTRTDPNASINIDVLLNDKINKGDTLKLCSNAISVRPSHGTVMVNSDGTISYKPAIGYSGIDSFNYKLCNINVIDLNSQDCYSKGNDNAWVYIMVEGCTLPNAFSPDGDGVNDTFEIPCARGDVQFSVFNRWGIEVYRNDQYTNQWDGTYNNVPLPDGTYFYMLSYSSDNISKLNKDGFITLRR